jgi:hypothetical protein
VVLRVDSSVLSRPSRWSIDRFGEQVAAQLWTLVPRAIAAAVHRALDAHQAAQMLTDHAFGSGWPLPFEELVNHLESVDGATVVNPPPRTFNRLVVVGGHVLLPWRYADLAGVSVEDTRAVRPLSVLGRQLLRRYGPAPRWQEDPLPLFENAAEQRDADLVTSALDTIEPSPRVLIVGFASNSTQGLLHLCWGEAALAQAGNLHWHYHEDLPLPATPYIPHPRRSAE